MYITRNSNPNTRCTNQIPLVFVLETKAPRIRTKPAHVVFVLETKTPPIRIELAHVASMSRMRMLQLKVQQRQD
jgi:hypothetical protein